MVTIIVNNAQRIGLQVCSDGVTTGDGNCFYHAVLQQMQTNDIHTTSDVFHYPLPTHLELRQLICQYRTFYNNVLHEEYNMTWDVSLAN